MISFNAHRHKNPDKNRIKHDDVKDALDDAGGGGLAVALMNLSQSPVAAGIFIMPA